LSEPGVDPDIDWSLTTWEGSRREQMRRWAEAPLDDIILCLEELQAVSDAFSSGASIEGAPVSPCRKGRGGLFLSAIDRCNILVP
jgi:hypothetical protein